MNALEIFAALLTAPFRIVKIARDYERREVRDTAIGWNPGENTEQAGDWIRTEAEDSPSGEVEYHRVVRKPR